VSFQITQAGNSPVVYTITAAVQPQNGTYPNPIPLPTSPFLKICADGSKATWLKVTVSGGTVALSQLKFRVTGSTGDIGYSGAFNNSYEPGTNSVSTRLTHPRYMDEQGYGRFDEIELYSEADENTVLASLPVRIYRAPIAFIHGLKGNQSTFATMADRLLIVGQYPFDASLPWESPLLWRADYNATSTKRFRSNRKVVPDAISSLLNQAISKGYSCGKATVIGHSMGGILSSIYLESHDDIGYRQDINRLLTLSTPHFGTQFANHCSPSNLLFTPSACPSVMALIGLGSWAGVLSTGAVRDLRVNSTPIGKLNNWQQVNTIPSATLSSDGLFDGSPAASSFRFLFSSALSTSGANIFRGEQSDLVVPISSQLSNMTIQQTVPNQWHVGST